MGKNTARVPMIWPHQFCDSDDGKEYGKQDLESYRTQSSRNEIGNCQYVSILVTARSTQAIMCRSEKPDVTASHEQI